MFCTNCGKELRENAKFCTQCGAPVKTYQAPVEEPKPEAEKRDAVSLQKKEEPVQQAQTPPIAPQAAPTQQTPPVAPQAAPTQQTPPIAPQAAPTQQTPPVAPQAAPTQQTPPPAKKKSGGGVALIVSLAVVFFLLVIVGAGVGIYRMATKQTSGGSGKETAAQVESPAEPESVPEPEQSAQESLPSLAESREPERVEESVEQPQESEHEEQPGEEVSGGVFAEALSQIEQQYGRIRFDQVYTQGYVNISQDEDMFQMIPADIQMPEGILQTEIGDYDHDGQEELFVVLAREREEKGNSSRLLELAYQMYEMQDGTAVLAAERAGYRACLGEGDANEISIAVKPGEDRDYFAENAEARFFLCADGTQYAICVFAYDGEQFQKVAQKNYAGSDFSDIDSEEIAKTAKKLKKAGFVNTARMLDYTLDLQVEEEMRPLLWIKGTNPVLGKSGNNAGSSYVDASAWGEIIYRIAPSRTQMEQNSRITGYYVQTEDFSVTEDGKSVEAFFEKVVFEGGEGIGWLNEVIDAMCQEYQESLPDLQKELENLKESQYADENYEYSPHRVESVYVDEDGNVSIGWYWSWYIGGVFNSGYQTLNLNLYTGEPVFVTRFTGGDWYRCGRLIKEAVREQVDNGAALANDEACVKDLNTIHYYYDEDRVYIGYDAYALNQSGSGILVVIDREAMQTAKQDYILPDSADRFLTQEDLEGLTKEQLRLARNEIFARHGRLFQDEDLQRYFDSCPWYGGYIEPDKFDDSCLNEYEVKNRDFIVEYEELMGYR